MKNKVMTAEEAVKLIKSGDTVGITGFVGMGHPEEISKAIEERFLATGEPRDLTMTWGASQSDARTNIGLNRWCKEGLIKKLICGHFNLQVDLAKLISGNKLEAYALPQGVVMHLYRAIAAHKPGVITKVGLGTFVDPREECAQMNSISKDEVVKLVELDGEEYLWYKSFPIDVAIIRGTTADEKGNVSIEKEAICLEFRALAQAAHNSGGKVIVEVERLARAGTLDPRMVEVPGIYVDAIVVAKPENHWQSYASPYQPELSGEIRIPMSSIKPIPLDERKVICRRAAMELIPDAVINLGIGMPEGVGAVAAEEGIDELTMTVEPGIVGGVPQSGVRFGTAINPEAIIDHPSQFDFYDGGGLDLACLGMAEADQFGNINVTKFGPRVPGPGGFINISQNAKTVVFCGTLTAGGLEVEAGGGMLRIKNEGKAKKLVSKVAQISFSGAYARKSGQKVLYVTERAVFELRPEGVTLTEIAPGVDLEKDVIGQMGFKPIVASDLKTMDPRIFEDKPMGIKAEILANGK